MVIAISYPILVILGEYSLKYYVAVNQIRIEELERFINDLDFPISLVYRMARKVDSDKNRDFLHIVYDKKSSSKLLTVRVFWGLFHLTYTVLSIHGVLFDIDPLTRFSTLLYLMFAIPGFIVAVRFGHGLDRYMGASFELRHNDTKNNEP